jgi:hypothetical protein
VTRQARAKAEAPAGALRVRTVATSPAGARTGENDQGRGDGSAVGRGPARPRSTPPALRLLRGHGDDVPPEGRSSSWPKLWSAWRELPEWEDRVDALFGEDLGPDMLVVWALLRFGGSRDLDGLLTELVTDDLVPTFGGQLVHDIVRVAFVMGAAWRATRDAEESHADSSSGALAEPLEGPHLLH